jgi:hypothetical protein
MPDAQRIDPVLVEKVAKALHEQWEAELFPDPADRNAWESEVPPWRERTERAAEAAIRAVFDELGLKEGTVVYVARCTEHGLHGCRETCFECGKPVEQVPMVELDLSPALRRPVEQGDAQ